MKFLIDTNIVIQLEDDGEIKADFADLLRRCQEHGIHVFVHEASIEDINRHGNETRRKATLSKLNKFRQLKGVSSPTLDELKARYGDIPKPNDVVDAKLLHAVSISAADFLITEDDRLHRRAKRASLAERVMTVADALAWLKQSFEPDTVFLPAVKEVKAHAIDFQDPIFEALRSDYGPYFDKWTGKCINEHRDCWIVKDGDALAAVVIRKDERRAEAAITKPGEKILKICTFVSEDYRGQKLGEQLLKQIFWHAQRNSYDVVYLTAKAKQVSLIRLLEEYGFEKTGDLADGDGVFEKAMGKGKLSLSTGETAITAARKNYPRFYDGPKVDKFVIPIKPAYHAKLFPEVGMLAEEVATTRGAIPGNTIRKVYVCHSRNNRIAAGDVIFFYQTKKPGSPRSQSVTSIGIVENVRHTNLVDEVRRWTAKRSVFSDDELQSWVNGSSPLKVIDFLLIGHVVPPLPLNLLRSDGVVGGAPQSITRISENSYQRLKPLLNLGFDF
ncbi:GNAT family N-acetyltransferase [Sinorhizobium meliloti]|uniref:GNAT family N-acetyltransferase n=1 Tax=Rhizobium meliloti TaxID=382 RepID=UPI0013E3AE15|nr:GNAT family N-acetyltransferase [Sinorhizobium meliloti]